MDCIFCDIINGTIPAKIIAENDNAVAFLDVNPMSNGHTIIIPKKHYKNFSDCDQNVLFDVVSLAQQVTKILNKALKP
jgi:histidine triad (HIT) family protein